MIVIGHRGAAALAPENSLEAIEAAAAHGADAVELDVVRADGRAVLAHDAARAAGAVSLDAGVARAAELGLLVQADVKQPGLEHHVVEAFRTHGARGFVSSPSAAVLRAFARADPALLRSLTYPEDRRGLSGRSLIRPAVGPGLALLRTALPYRLPRLLRAANAGAATLSWTVVTPQAVAACRAAGAEVFVWTVNEPALARTLAETGIAGIIGDDPRILVGGISSS